MHKQSKEIRRDFLNENELKGQTFIEFLGYVFSFVFVAFVIVFIISVATTYGAVIERDRLEKFSVELSDNLLESDLTIRKNILNPDALEFYDSVDGPVEPHARGCEYAYSLRIECLDQDSCGDGKRFKEEYSFGYLPTRALYLPNLVIEFPVAISEDIVPAKMILETYNTELTTISCMVEKAYKMREVQSEGCLVRDAQNSCISPVIFAPDVRKEGDDICTYWDFWFTSDDCIERRYLPDVEMKTFAPDKTGHEKVLKALPLKKGYAISAGTACNDIDMNFLAQEGDEVMVVLCFEY